MIAPDRYLRQAELVPHLRLASLAATVIGVGAIGRQVAVQLTAIGIPRLQLIDFDRVDPTNVVTQGFAAGDIGRPKVTAVAEHLSSINPALEVQTIVDRYRPRTQLGDIIFCSVDSMISRAAIWRSAGQQARFWADGRMLGEVLRILVATSHCGRNHYPTTLFAPAEVQTGRCTARSTIYAATIAAGLLVHQFTRFLRDLPLDADSSLNLLAGEWTVLS